MAKGKHFKKRNKGKFLIVCFTLILFASIICIVLNLINRGNHDKLIISMKNDNSLPINNTNNNVETERMKKLKELQRENSDIIGWIEIEGSTIDYPVLQTTDNSFYMTHDYKKEYSKDGSLFLDKEYDWNLPSTNLLIYGHNNIDSTAMFSGLLNYEDENYYNNHKFIRFTTNKEDVEYEIIAVFLSRVYYKSEQDVFRYYYFINAANEEEFENYVKSSKEASLYDIEATAQYGDQLLTLSTCSYHTEDGRLAVVARRVYE